MNNNTLIKEPTQTANSSVIWLHGLGANANDFAPIVPVLNLPNTRFIFPNAPIRPVTINMGMEMPAWYDIFSLDRFSKQDEAGIKASTQTIRSLIQAEVDKGIQTERIVLAGFSQGAAMVLYAGTRFEQKLAGILALSGYLPLGDQLAAEKSPLNLNTPIFIAHGDYDVVVPPSFAELTMDTLNQAGFSPTLNRYPMEHSVSDQEVRDIREQLATWLA